MAFFIPQRIEKQLAEIEEAVYRDVRAIPRFKFWQSWHEQTVNGGRATANGPILAATQAGDNGQAREQRLPRPASPGRGTTGQRPVAAGLMSAETTKVVTTKGDSPHALAAVGLDDSHWADFQVGETWGGYDVTAWFRARVPIPETWREQRVYLRFLVGPRDGGGSTAETMLYVDGEPLQAIDVWHEEAWLPPEYLQRGEILVALKAWSGVLDIPPRRRFARAQLALIDEASEKLAQITRVLLQAIEQLDENELRRMVLLQALDEAYGCIDFAQPGSPAFYASVADALACLQEQLSGMEGAEGGLMAPAMKPRVSAVGHAHIDLAWLWRLRHAREKAARTFTTALHLMREYPEYRFTHSSPQLFKFLKEDYPDIYARVKERICAGQWEVTGGMWVEADANIPNGESLVRHFLLGQRYLREEFGVTCRLLWLPDVFGYSWALPQIACQSGIDYFLTSKISWNQFNRFPYDTFLWRGIDGTELLTYFITTPAEDNSHYTYNGQLSPRDVKGTWDLYNQKETNHELLTLFGWGDGGGGPTREMLEAGRVLKDLPGFPMVQQEPAEDFFARLADRLAHKKLPVWDGELYLELHRGTYTSQAYNKRANRRAEILYHNAEWLSALAAVLCEAHDGCSAGGGAETALREGWELLLLNQFHDILPGSSIREVYEDSREDYARVEEIGNGVLTAAQAEIQGELAPDGDALIVYNPLSWERDGVVSLPLDAASAQRLANHEVVVLDAEGNPSPVQVVGEGDEQGLLLQVSGVPSLGYAAYPLAARGPSEGAPVGASEGGVEDGASLVVTPNHLENRYWRLTLNARGQLTSVWDKRRGREVLAEGQRGNVLQVFVDRPLKFDAWDIDIFYQDHVREVDELLEAEVEEAGPLRGALRLRWRYLGSTITQRLTLYAHSPRIDFRTEVDWQEKQMLLKAAFPVAVRATRATYEIQFGSIERPTHWNTSWDYARFEVAAQKWADLSEGGYGVALLNDCKYGYDVKDNVLRLTLIKSAVRPDALADKGEHHFTYSLLAHEGDWRAGARADEAVVRQAHDLNNPLWGSVVGGQPGGRLPRRYSLVEVGKRRLEAGDWRLETGDRRPETGDCAHVILDTVKRAEDGDGWIVRLYECEQRRGTVTLTFGAPLAGIVPCNLLEEPLNDDSLRREGNQATFDIGPYEIRSFRVWFER